MELGTVAAFSDYGVLGIFLGLSLAVNVFTLVQWTRGIIVSHKMVEQANEMTRQVQAIADRWQKAWEVEMAAREKFAEALNKLTVQGDTMMRILEALPPVMHRPGEVD